MAAGGIGIYIDAFAGNTYYIRLVYVLRMQAGSGKGNPLIIIRVFHNGPRPFPEFIQLLLILILQQ